MPTKFSAFDAAEYLDSEEAIAAYLNEVLAEDDQDLLLSALDDVARARGMTQVADAAGLTRPGLYKALKPGAKTGFVTVRKIAGALGLKIVLAPYTEKAAPTRTVKPVKESERRFAAAASKTKPAARQVKGKAHA
jgi:probable addiction module antidote protein